MIKDDIETGFWLTEQIARMVSEGNLPRDALEYADRVSKLLDSVYDYIERNGECTSKQSVMVLDIICKLETWYGIHN